MLLSIARKSRPTRSNAFQFSQKRLAAVLPGRQQARTGISLAGKHPNKQTVITNNIHIVLQRAGLRSILSNSSLILGWAGFVFSFFPAWFIIYRPTGRTTIVDMVSNSHAQITLVYRYPTANGSSRLIIQTCRLLSSAWRQIMPLSIITDYPHTTFSHPPRPLLPHTSPTP